MDTISLLKGKANSDTSTHTPTHTQRGQMCRSDKNRNGENGKWNENIFISFINVNEALSLEQFWLQRGTEQLQGIHYHDVTSCQDWGGWGTVGLQRAKECRREVEDKSKRESLIWLLLTHGCWTKVLKTGASQISDYLKITDSVHHYYGWKLRLFPQLMGQRYVSSRVTNLNIEKTQKWPN